jgi:hypothetical protein
MPRRFELKIMDFPGDGMTKPLILIACCSSLLSGCHLFGYYRYKGAERAPPEEAEKVAFPNSYENGFRLDGPAMAALEVARNEFMPPGVKATAHDERIARCLLRRDIYDVTILEANDDLFFVSFSPDLSKCNINTEGFIILDSGATYAIDGRGRVLAVQ